MNVSTNKKYPLGYSGDVRIPYAMAGWRDAIAGRPFDYALIDSAPYVCGAAYETARLRVMALRDAGLPIPQWRSVKTVPPRVRSAISLANSFNAMARESGAPFWGIGAKYWRAAE